MKKGKKYKINKNIFKIKHAKFYNKNNRIKRKSGARNIKFENKNGVDLSDMIGQQAIEYDELFLNHEFYELNYMKEFNCTYEQAHKAASKLYNWEKIFLSKELKKGLI